MQFRAAGTPSLPLEAEAIDALAQFIKHNELIARVKQRPWPQWQRAADAVGNEKVLNEAESLAVLAHAGLSVVPHHLSRSEAEAATAWRNFGGPVAIKGCTSDITHKTEHGLVQLNLDDEDAIKESYRKMEKGLAAQQASFDGVIVARMVKGRREMLIGAHRDPIFGPVVVVGEGGKYVEAMPDLKLLLPPFDAEDVMRALLSLRCATVLKGVRGEPPMDIRAMAQAAMQVAELMRDPAIQSLDINPLMLGSDGEGYAVLDAVVIRNAER
jgi:acyl-CoA synthetase (NDP forming)